jgi:hypothetical protein
VGAGILGGPAATAGGVGGAGAKAGQVV